MNRWSVLQSKLIFKDDFTIHGLNVTSRIPSNFISKILFLKTNVKKSIKRRLPSLIIIT